MTTGLPNGAFTVPDKTDARVWRSHLFQQLDGLALTILAPLMEERGILSAFDDGQAHDVDVLAEQLGAHAGYLNVLCRLCASQGWLSRAATGGKVLYRRTDKVGWEQWRSGMPVSHSGREWLAAAEGMWNRADTPMSAVEQSTLDAFMASLDGAVNDAWSAHWAGALAAPWLVTLGTVHGTAAMGDWHALSQALAQLHPSRGAACMAVLKKLGYLGTPEGGFFLARAASFGVTTSYIKTFLWAEELLFGDGGKLWRTEPGEAEIHVDRTLNVWGSGGAHSAYFGYLDEVVRTIFDAPLEGQPRGICDMGCGNGALLLHLEEFIRTETLRGKHLDSHPLVLVGADFNQAALDATEAHFVQEGVDGHFVWGDIGDPDRLDLDLQHRHGIALGDLLNVRSFLDHNRVFNRPVAQRTKPVMTTGAFAFRGERLRSSDVEQSLVEHFGKWRPHVARHGLLVIELHTMDPAEAADRHGRVPATAYDATHGFSDQYIVEVPVFDAMAAEVGLRKVEAVSRTFPSALPATVSLRYFLGD